jgi:hypothetical protein
VSGEDDEEPPLDRCLDVEGDCDEVEGRFESFDVLFEVSSYSKDCFTDLRPKVLIAVEIASFSTVSSSEVTRNLRVDSSNLWKKKWGERNC